MNDPSPERPTPDHDERPLEIGHIERLLRRWHDAGLIGADQREGIVAFERDAPDSATSGVDAAGGSVPAGSPAPRAAAARSTSGGIGSRRAVGVEAIGYVGAALAIGAIALIVGDVWADLLAGGRLALALLVTVVLTGSGLALRRSPNPPMLRLSATLLAGAVAAVAWSVATFAGDIAMWRGADVTLAVGLASVIAAGIFYRLASARALVQVALLAAVVTTALALLERPAIDLASGWMGLVFWALGVAWYLVGRGGWLAPARLAEVLGGLLALLALQVTAWSGATAWLLALAVATAVALVAIAVIGERGHDLAVGALGLFVLVPQLVFELFGEHIGAPATLLVVGLLLVLVAVGLGRARREVTGDGASPPGDGPGDEGGGDAGGRAGSDELRRGDARAQEAGR